MSFKYIFKHNSQLSQAEIEDMYHLNVRMYPEFAPVYKKNRYYSYAKPEMLMMVYDDKNNLVADVNYSWRLLYAPKAQKSFMLAYFGILVDEPFQKQGIGAEVINRLKQETIARNFDGLYASTKNPVVKKLLEKHEFKEIKTELIWHNPTELEYQIVQEEGYTPFGFFVQENIFEQEDSIFLGDGPI